ncbi:helix-turn-helix domain-containing protein [Nonomuraea sp. NPDC050691]|uniref:helix-turn-helix domain-containing protein n=1 Tax=Nonomuraea sp. NPDC050691 TaxID=3155661 RepID=UPI00340B456B
MEPRSREGTRRRILDAACRLFAEHGYDEVTMRMLGAAANANIALSPREETVSRLTQVFRACLS